MTARVLVIGGYGNFGRFISRRLARNKDITVIIAGRDADKARIMAQETGAEHAALDIRENFSSALDSIHPDIVIHTSGPFQTQGYDVAQACIAKGCHYIDLSDGRDFVSGIDALHHAAKERGVLVISGASSVPCLTSALLDHYKNHFETLDTLDYGITTAQRTARGHATTAAILGYAGKPLQTRIGGRVTTVFGWQGLRARKYPGFGWRFLGYCDVPDLALFPLRYPDLKTIRFYAGLELPFIHLTLWGLSWLVRMGLIRHLDRAAPFLLKLSGLFDWLGSSNSAFHMELSGTGKDGRAKTVRFDLTARSGDGPYIPCTPAILLAERIAAGALHKTGAMPCIGLITRDEYLDTLKELDIHWEENWSG